MDKNVLIVGFGVFAVLGAILALDRCGEPAPPSTEGDSIIQRHGDWVYYFSHKTDFGDALATFIEEHPELRIVSVAPLDTSTYGSTRGYWVVVEKKEAAPHESKER